MTKKCVAKYVTSLLEACVTCTTTFDLCTNKGTSNTVFFMVNFLYDNWKPKHVRLRLFETSNTTNAILFKQFHEFLENFDITKTNTCDVKYEGANWAFSTNALKHFFSCEALGMIISYDVSCFSHAMFANC
jgi:hypothetical protein